MYFVLRISASVQNMPENGADDVRSHYSVLCAKVGHADFGRCLALFIGVATSCALLCAWCLRRLDHDDNLKR